MKWAEKTRQGIEGWFTDKPADDKPSWAQRIIGAFTGAISNAFITAIEAIEPEALSFIDEFLAKLIDTPFVPDNLKRMMEKVRAGGKPIPLLLAIPIGVLLFLPMVTSLVQPLGRLLNYVEDRVLHSYRMDPATLRELLRRDPELFSNLKDDLNDLGFSPERIEAFDELLKAIPPLADMVRFADFSAFDPEVIERWREYYDAPAWISGPFSLLGITGEWANRYWFSHFVQPGRYELGEMYRRGLIDDDTVKLAYKTMGYSSFWQDNLLNLVREVPTRVDVRRWWDMRTIDETELRRIYHALGYFDQDLENYVLWTKVYVAFPDLMSRYSNGYITLDDVRAELVSLGMPADRVEELIETKVAASSTERTSSERDLTKSDIYKGVKQGRITRGEGLELLMELGYDENEADYLLDINIPEDETDEQVEYRQLTKSDIKAGLLAEELTEDEAREKLLELRYSASDTELLLRIFEAAIEPPTEEKLKEVSKTDVISGVKKGVITAEEGYLILQEIGYSADAAEFILSVQAETSPFSPTSYNEFKDLTTKWRTAAGMTTKPVPEELKEAANELVQIKLEVESLERSEKEEKGKLTAVEEVPDSASARLKEIQVALNRARAELQRIQLNYNSLVAEWRHAAG